ncbi:MAG: succinate--CoA ligase subunit alpha [Armatimonadetes bacterium]|nr:succinate--CoA ligase subunit alpha [Armatimonadota bacterium]
MGILITKETKVLVQGITGKEGSFHAQSMLKYGTKIIAGVTPNKGGEKIFGIPVFNTVMEACLFAKVDASIIFVPAYSALQAILEALEREIKLIVCITEGIPLLDMIKIKEKLKQSKSILIGPNCPGVITAGESKIGIMPGDIFQKGNIGIISRSGTLTYEVVSLLSKNSLGQSTCVGIGGDPLIGTSFLEVIKLFEKDSQTDLVVLIGEIGGTQEEEAAEYLASSNLKALAFIAGATAPAGKRMGHAGAIISQGKGKAESKIEAFKRSKVAVARNLIEIPDLIKKLTKN